MQAEKGLVRRAGGAMAIREPGAGPAGASGAEGPPASQQMDADMDFARQLQAQMDAEEARRECASASSLRCCPAATDGSSR